VDFFQSNAGKPHEPFLPAWQSFHRFGDEIFDLFESESG